MSHSLTFTEVPWVWEKKGTPVRIVHVSDTHKRHNDYLASIPDGDIFVHSGDFDHKMKRDDSFQRKMEDFNHFLGTLPHKHKIFVAGNHEIAFNDYSKSDIQKMLPNCIYLQDSSTTLMGITFHGSPWTTSSHMGFSCKRGDIEKKWKKISRKTDIVITHMPPHNILDLAFSNRAIDSSVCADCGESHERYRHWGSATLKARIEIVNPKYHLYGHVHDDPGFKQQGDTVFVNSAVDLKGIGHCFDYYV